MSLAIATVLAGFVLLLAGGVFLLSTPALRDLLRKAPRSEPLALVLMVLAGAWFLYRVLQLGPAEFGNYKNLLFLLFFALLIASWFFIKDFLAVRMGAGLALLGADKLLDSAFAHWDEPLRLLLVLFAYVVVVLSMYLAAAPFRMRDFLEWLYTEGKELRPRAFGGALAAYGILLMVAAAGY